MPEITIVDAETGRILQTSDVPEGDVALQNRWPIQNGSGGFDIVAVNSRIIIEGKFDGRTQYWRNNAVVDRPTLCRKLQREIAASGSDRLSVGKVPPGTIVVVDGDEYQVDDGVFEFTTAHPGTYKIVLRPPFPWQQQTLTVVAV
ncbi:MAG: hypothetical protein ACYCZ0_01805 [Minisyncoccota bacterium]